MRLVKVHASWPEYTLIIIIKNLKFFFLEVFGEQEIRRGLPLSIRKIINVWLWFDNLSKSRFICWQNK